VKTESLMVITDARAVLFRRALGEAQGNPLAAAFLGWLLGSQELEKAMEAAATKAAAAKGAKRSSRNVAVLGFACGVESLKSRFSAELLPQLEWSMGRPNFASGGEPCSAVADPVILTGMFVGAEGVLDGEARARFEQWAGAARKDAEGLAQDGGWRGGLLNLIGRRLDPVDEKLLRRTAGEPVWLAAGLQRRGWGAPAETSVADVLKVALTGADGVSDGF